MNQQKNRGRPAVNQNQIKREKKDDDKHVENAQLSLSPELIKAIKQRDFVTVKALMESKGSGYMNAVNNCGCTAISMACSLPSVDQKIDKENMKVIEYLLTYCDADINQADSSGWTPLMQAVAANSDVIVKLLTGYKADLFLRNKSGHTALSIAQGQNSIEIASHLQDKVTEKNLLDKMAQLEELRM